MTRLDELRERIDRGKYLVEPARVAEALLERAYDEPSDLRIQAAGVQKRCS